LEGFGCSPINRVRELGSHSQKKENKKQNKKKDNNSMNKTQINLNPTGRVNTLSSSSLPIILQSVFIGIMLGDGSLYRSSPTSNVRFEMSFGQKYEAFALHLGELFKDYMLNPVKSLEVKGLNKKYTNYRLKTRSLPIFVPYFNMFYIFNQDLNKHVKIIPQNIIELLDPVVLAYLIQTDGNFDKGRNRVRIYTNSYQKEDVKNLAIAINKKWAFIQGFYMIEKINGS
jgi:hypothetical protein